MEYLRVRNWEKYQVYKDGRPMLFFAVQVSILDDVGFLELENDPSCQVFRLMALAARTGNRLPNNPEWLQAAIHSRFMPNIEKMVAAGFLEPAGPEGEQVGYVYFARQDKSADEIKIGYTANPRERARKLNCELIAFPGTRADERELHDRFEGAALGNEWFDATSELATLMEEFGRTAEKFRPYQENNIEEEKKANAFSSVTDNDEIGEIYDHWRTVRGKNDRRYAKRIAPERRSKIKARLREFSADELKRALDNVALDPWEERPRHDDLTVLFRNQTQVEKFLALTDAKERREAATCPACGVGGGLHLAGCGDAA